MLVALYHQSLANGFHALIQPYLRKIRSLYIFCRSPSDIETKVFKFIPKSNGIKNLMKKKKRKREKRIEKEKKDRDVMKLLDIEDNFK